MEVLVDKKAALDELGIELEDYLELVTELRKFADSTLPKLGEQIQSAHWEEVEETAHSLKGAFRNLRFIKAARLAENLEVAGRESGTGQPQEDFNNLREVLEESLVQLNI